MVDPGNCCLQFNSHISILSINSSIHFCTCLILAFFFNFISYAQIKAGFFLPTTTTRLGPYTHTPVLSVCIRWYNIILLLYAATSAWINREKKSSPLWQSFFFCFFWLPHILCNQPPLALNAYIDINMMLMVIILFFSGKNVLWWRRWWWWLRRRWSSSSFFHSLNIVVDAMCADAAAASLSGFSSQLSSFFFIYCVCLCIYVCFFFWYT